MKKRLRRLTAFVVALAVMASFIACPNVEAATKLKVKSSKKITLNIGKTATIKTNVAANKLKFKSSNKKVVTVNSKGKITAKKAGKANITVTSKKNKKQKVTIKVTVLKKKTTQATTTKSNVTTTTQQTPVVTTTTEAAATTQASEETTTTSSSATTEGTASGDATTEERKVVGITAKYRGDKVPDDIDQIITDGVDLKLLYSDNSTEEIYITYDNYNQIKLNYINTEVINGLKYANYKVSYLGFETTFRVQLVETATLYPIQIDTKYTGGTIPKDTIPNKEDIKVGILLSDCETSIDADMSKFRLICYRDWNTSIYDKRKEYQYVVISDYTFKDENNNELYVCTWSNIYVPYE